MEGEGGGVWGNECPFLKSDICTIYLPITLFMHVDCFFCIRLLDFQIS